MSVALERATPANPVRVGRYDVTGLIRQGGMGTVYDAVDREHGARVALKTLTHLDPQSLLRFKNEFRAAADLSHPNLVPLYELGCHEGVWFFTMERVHGVDFVEHVRGHALPHPPRGAATTLVLRAGVHAPPAEPVAPAPPALPALPESIPRLRAALAQLVRGVHALHAAGLLHLDLKPGNVLVDQSGRVVVLDFGLVQPIEQRAPEALFDAPEDAVIAGTPEWMAPEQFVGSATGEATDWYAVGAMLYVALTGLSAFPRESLVATWFAKQHVPPVAPEQLLADVPADLAALASALLQSDPAARPRGATLLELTSSEAVGRERAATLLARSTLVGRDAEQRALRDALARVRAGGSAVVHVAGASGVGKSALLEAFAAEAREDALVLRGRCYEREGVPYKAFDGMLDGLAAHLLTRPLAEVADALPHWIDELARVFPVLAAVPAVALRIPHERDEGDGLSEREHRRRAVEALRAFFANLAARRPLVVLVDDLQWADADSTALLSRLLAAPAPPGLLVAVSYREDEARGNEAVARYLAHVADARADHVDVALGPLDRAAARRLAGAALASLAGQRAVDAALADAIADEAGALPFFIEELALVAAQRGADRAAGVTLEDVLARRVRALPGAARALVEVLAVANNPTPLAVAFAVADVDAGALRALWTLRASHFVRSTGAGARDRAELQHDKTREAVLGSMVPSRIEDLHLALGSALAAHEGGLEPGPWLFDAVRHLNAVPHRLAGEERRAAARMNLQAGQRARRAGAFRLAFECLHAGAALLSADAWSADYALALALHGGAAEAAYLGAAWDALDAHIAAVTAHARGVLDQRVAWEVAIDAAIARGQYDAAVDAALAALRLLDVDLPAHPGDAEVAAEFARASDALARVGLEALAQAPLATDPVVTAAMRIQSRISSAAYFARPALFPVIACRLVETSVRRGLSPATPYALGVYGIVLNTLGQHVEAHACGALARAMLARFEDQSLVARTLHVVHDLVCVFTVPLAGTLDELRRAVDIGRETGDVEYTAYAAHAYVHNALYAARPLGPLRAAAAEYGAFMRGHEQVNALHVHAPFERVLACFAGGARDPACLDGEGFTEAGALASAAAAGSRSAQCIVRLLMGVVRYHFGSAREASAHLEAARPFLDGVASTWHVPMFHQYAALALCARPADEREAHRAALAASASALHALAASGAANFAHRAALVDAEQARVAGALDAARPGFARAIEGARAGAWWTDLGLAHELAARCHDARGAHAEAAQHRAEAREAYARWGATALVARLAAT